MTFSRLEKVPSRKSSTLRFSLRTVHWTRRQDHPPAHRQTPNTMSTLKHKLFIKNHSSKKRKLLLKAKEDEWLNNADDGRKAAELRQTSSDDASKLQQRRHRQAVRFCSTLDVITKPYTSSLTDAETLDLCGRDMWYDVSYETLRSHATRGF